MPLPRGPYLPFGDTETTSPKCLIKLLCVIILFNCFMHTPFTELCLFPVATALRGCNYFVLMLRVVQVQQSLVSAY